MRDKWNEIYGSREYRYGFVPNDFLRENYQKISKGKVLCIGSGEGRNAVFLAEKGYDVTAVDFSEKGIEKTQALANKKKVSVKTIVSDVLDYDFGENEYEAVINIFLHFESDERKIIAKKIRNALKPGGVFLLEVYHLEQLASGTAGPKDEKLLLTEDRVIDDYQNFSFDILRKVHRQTYEDHEHRGGGVVVQLIARPIK
ncbi:MAG: SAM-dependent methyltransferase [Clostridiales bacterium]|nr:MAG: SAM-dependent methyltransferase [Clostridiales bacterium]